jgi:hypothetical protein
MKDLPIIQRQTYVSRRVGNRAASEIVALYFILYGITNEEDIRYILSTFPIVERKDCEAFQGVYLTRELILWYKRALEAGRSGFRCAGSRRHPSG